MHERPERHRPFRILSTLIAAACLVPLGCGGPNAETPAAVEALLESGRLEEAAAGTRALVVKAPDDPALRVLLGRVHLAQGDARAAQAAFERAAALGAADEDLREWRIRSLLAQGLYERALSLLPASAERADLESELLDLRLRALLHLPLARPGDIFLDARERLTRDGPAAQEAIEALADEATALDANAEQVRRAIAYWSCQRSKGAGDPSVALYQPPWADLTEDGRRILEVGPTRTLKTPSAAARVAKDGDIVEIDGGVYDGDVAVWEADGLWIRSAGGKVILPSNGAIAENMGIWVIRGDHTVVDGVRFTGARAPHRNGSGIRLHAHNLWVRHSEFHDNEAGLLTFNEPGGEVIVEHSIFTENGAGDGQSHNVYVGRTDRLIFRFNYSAGSRIGHQLKSRALANHILYNRLADEQDGTSSYTIDLPEGGYALVMGNELHQGPGTVNRHMVSLGAENSSARAHRFVFVHNTFYNHTFPATLVRDATGAGVVFVNNIYAGAPAAMDTLVTLEAGNAPNASSSLVDAGNGDYRLAPTSPLIDQGASLRPLELRDVPASPPFEYVHPAKSALRRAVWMPDPGAHEFCGWPEQPQ